MVVKGAAGLTAASSRVRPIWQQLSDELDRLIAGRQAPVRVLDCGGGTGSMAVPLAAAGADVTVLDASVDALATLQRRAGDADVAARVHALQGDVEDLSRELAPASFDLVLAHGLLESVEDPHAALNSVLAAVCAGGTVSVVIANPDAVVLARVLAGDLPAALAELTSSGGGVRFGPQQVASACTSAGFEVTSFVGLGIFADLIPGERAEAAPDVVEQLEQVAAERSPYRDIAARAHLLLRRPATR